MRRGGAGACEAVETLDLRSVGVTLSLCGFALTTVLWAARRDGDRIDGLNLWIASAVTMSAGLGVSALYGWIPEWGSRVVGNTLLVMAPYLAWQGARAFHGKDTHFALTVFVAIVTFFWSVAFVHVWPSVRIRIVMVSLAMALGCIAAGREFLRSPESHLRVAARFGGVPMFAFALMMTIRAIDAWMRSESELSTAFNPTPVNVATYLAGSLVLLSAIAGMVMSVMATRSAQIRDLAYRDLLTSVLSRRGLYAGLSKWAREHLPGASVVVLDANGFKRVNDLLGHETGDKILQALASSCVQSLPAEALVARFGGDEFVALIPAGGDTEVELSALARTFRDQCAKLLGDAGAPLPTVAIGRATLTGPTTHDFAAALREADAAMYAQKLRQRAAVRADIAIPLQQPQ